MDMTVRAGRFGGVIPAIASKSCAHRMLICAALGQAPGSIVCKTVSDDILATAACLRALGAGIEKTPDGFAVTPIDRAHLPENARPDAGESGSTLRFLVPVAAALGAKCEFFMHGRLPERPLSPLRELLEENGVTLSPAGSNPLAVSGRLTGHDFSLPADVSSQFLSGLLFALPLLGGGTLTMTGRVESGSYLDLTVDALRRYGVSVSRDGMKFTVSGDYRARAGEVVEGDWSNASVWLCAGAIGPAPVTVTGLRQDSAQGDRAVLDILSRFGARVFWAGDAVTVSPGKLTGIEFDASDIPDLVPVLSAVACRASGRTVIRGASRLRIKESDRLAATADVLGHLGAAISETPDGLVIDGGRPLSGGTVNAWNDHRIAMTAAAAALLASGSVTITGAQAVNKSYPAFFEDFAALGGETEASP